MLKRSLYAVLLLTILFTPSLSANSAPTGHDDTVLVAQFGSATIPLLLNDSDPDGDILSLVSTTSPSSGTLVNNGDNTVTYTPSGSFTGDDSFDYTLSDGNGNQATATVNLTVNLAIDGAAARTQIMSGVSTIYADGFTGNLAAYGPTAYAVVHYPPDGSTPRGPMAAIAGWGAGKVAVLPDHQSLQMNSRGSQGDTGQFYKNTLAWLAGTTAQTINIVTYDADNTTWLTSQGYSNVTTTNVANLATDLATADVFVAGWLEDDATQATLDTVAAYVKGGGALYLADYGQGYVYWWNKPFYQIPSNLMLRTAGLAFTGDNVWLSGLLDATNIASGQINADVLLDMLADSSSYTAAELDEGGRLLGSVYDGLPPNDLLAAQLDSFFWAAINSINPTPATPVSDSFEKALLGREADLLVATAPADVVAHRTAAAVYGTIPANAPRVTQDVVIRTDRSRWQPTGLYVVPGEVVTLTFPATLVGQGFKVRVNAHTDDISQRDDWERPPYVHRAFDIDATTVDVANAFGGSIFIDLGGNAYSAPANLGNQTITIANAIEQPYFVLGQHSDNDWLTNLRDNPAPYAVFAADNIVLSFRSAEAASLTEPTALMTWWNDVVAGQDYLANRPTPRTGAEIINVDVQNSAGAAHAGFPIQAWDKHWGNLADWDDLQLNGSWGDFHELGHNQQRGWWTFSGDGEVTVNIFSDYSQETQAANPSGGWSYANDRVATIQQAITDVSGGGSYASKSDRWSFWFQLADGFGWEMYRQVFATYEDDNVNNPSALPDTTQEEKDEWFVRWSTESGYDMKRFMVDTWGLQVSQSAIDAVAALPDWMPLVGGLASVEIITDVPQLLDIGGNALSMDGVATLSNVTNPSHGTLTDHGDGTYTYTATGGYVGPDSLTYTLQSSAGNTETFTLTIEVVAGVIVEYWDGVGGTAVSDLTSHPAFPNEPDSSQTVPRLELPANRADSYGAWVRAYVVPPVSGDYTFWIASDDQGELFLSSNDTPENKVLLASVPGWTNENDWDKYPEQESAVQTLTAGQRYYIEARLKESGGGDNLQVAWAGPNLTQQLIAGEHLRRFVNHEPVFDGDPLVETAALQDTPYSSSIADNASDADVGNPLTFAKVSGPAWLVVAANGDLSGTPSSSDVGLNSFTVSVDDGRGGYSETTLQITVNNVNDPPTVSGGSFDLYAGSANSTIVATLTVADPDPGDTVTLAITAGNTGNAFAINNAGELTVADTNQLTAPNSFTLTITATDNGTPVKTGEATVSITLFDCPTTTEVATTADSGPCSLRWAVAQASSNDTITFSESLANQTIYLASVISIPTDMTIDGGDRAITLSGDSDKDGDGDVQVFFIEQSRNVTLDHLNIVNGRSSTGALQVAWYADLTLKNSTFADNESSYYGGGAIHAQGLVYIENSTFSNNYSPSAGGAISIRGTGNSIKNSTFVGNGSATTGGIAASGTWHLYNSVIDSATGADCGGDAPTTSVNNHVADGGCGAAQSGDPQLGPLQDNGGPTLTHAPLAGSPLLNQGDNATCLAADQRGIERPLATTCDIGAVEAVGSMTLDLTLGVGGLTAVFPDWGNGCTYTIHESDNPYFTLPATTTHAVTAAAPTMPNTVGTHYYILQATGCVNPAIESDEMGKFEFGIVPGE